MAGVLGRAFIQVFADLSKFTPGLKQEIQKALNEQTRGVKFEELDKSAEKAGENAADEMAKGVDRKIENNMKKEGKKGGDALWTGLVGAFRVATVAFLPTLIALAIELVAALAPAAVALAATIPAAIGTAIAGAVALKLAFSGVGAAIKDAFDPSKAAQFNAALKKLAPAARSFVLEIKNLHPLFHQLQQDVQQAFFVQLQGVLTRVTHQLLPVLHRGLQQVAADLGAMGRQLLKAFGNGREDLASIFIAAHEALKPFIPLVGQLASAFLTIGAVAGPLFASLSQGFARVLGQFVDFINRTANSGGMSKFFDDMLVILQQLGGFLHNTFNLITAIITALQSTGGQSLGFLSALVGTLAQFFQSASGQQLLISLFGLLNQALKTLTSVLTPLLPPLSKLITDLANGLTGALKGLTPWLDKVANFLAKNPDLLKVAAGAWLAYRAAVLAAAAAEALVDVLNPVGAIIAGIALYIAWVVILIKHFALIKHWFLVVVDAVRDFFVGVWHWIQSIGHDIANWFTVTLPEFFSSLPGKIGHALEQLPVLLFSLFQRALYLAGEAIGIGVGLIIAYFIKMPGWIWDAIKAIGSLIGNLFRMAWDFAVHAVDVGWHATLDFFEKLPGRIVAFITSIPGIIRNVFVTAWNDAKNAVVRGGNAVIDFVMKLPGRIRGFMDNVGHDILSGLKSGINAVISGFNHGIDKVAGFIHIGLPHLPMLAAGGLVTAPTLAVVGEAGPEAVVPMGSPNQARRVAQRTGLLDVLAQGLTRGGDGATQIHVYLGTREITDILDVRIDKKLDDQARELAYGTR